MSVLYFGATAILLAFATGMIMLGVLLPLRAWGQPGALFYAVMATLGGAAAWVVIIRYSPRVYRIALDPRAGHLAVRDGPLWFRKQQRTFALDELDRVVLERGEREGWLTRSSQRIIPVFQVELDGSTRVFLDDDELLVRRVAERVCAAARVPLHDRTGLESARIDPEDLDLPLVERLLQGAALREASPDPPSSLISVKRAQGQLSYSIRSRAGPLAPATTLTSDGSRLSVERTWLGLGRRLVLPLEAVERLSADERIVKSTPTGVEKQCLFRIVGGDRVIDIPTSSRSEAEWLRDRFGFDLADLLTG